MRIQYSGMICLMLGLGCFAYCQWAPPAESTVENYWLNGDTLLIRLSDGTGWMLDIYREGDGRIRYGRHPNNALTFEKAGFNFDVLRRQLAGDRSKGQKKGFQPARIDFLISDTESRHSEILNDLELGQELFTLALEAAVNGKADLRAKRRMLKLFRTNPPFGKKD